MNNDKTAVVHVLEQLGISSVAAKTYVALLELNSASIRKVAERSGINRGTTYEAIKGLVAQGLVSARRNGKREQYMAESPERILDIIRDRRKELLQMQRDSERLVPALLAQKASPQGGPLVKYYEDDEGVAAILRDVLQTCGRLGTSYCVYSSQPVRHYLYRKLPEFTERRIREGIHVRVIAVGRGGDPAALSERKWLPESTDTGSSSYTIIYGYKVAVISISSGDVPYGVVIEDGGNASMQQLLFDQLWASLA